MRYRIEITENVNHVFIIEAANEDEAVSVYQNYTSEQIAALDLDGEGVWDSHPWEVAEDNETPAPLQIASASSAVASPELEAAIAHAHALASNPCDGGDPLGFGVYCSDNSGEWIETGFTDEEAAERFAAAWTAYRAGNHARVGLVISNDRTEWEAMEDATAALGCGNECGHSQEFTGWVDENQTAHFLCPNCGTMFEHSEWFSFFDQEDDDTHQPPANAIGARCVIRWERYKSASDKSLVDGWEELDRYISFSTYNEETETDAHGFEDSEIFYYATREEFKKLCINGEYHADGWELVSYEWVTR
jgi:hypothetical protein